MMRTARWATLATVAVGALIGVGCGDGASWNDGGRSRPRLSLEIVGEPTVAYDPARGRTTVVAQFIARDRNGVPLDPADLSVAMRVDGDQVDNESVLQQSSEELASSLHYALVLDASGSMLQHVPQRSRR